MVVGPRVGRTGRGWVLTGTLARDVARGVGLLVGEAVGAGRNDSDDDWVAVERRPVCEDDALWTRGVGWAVGSSVRVGRAA